MSTAGQDLTPDAIFQVATGFMAAKHLLREWNCR